MRSAATTRSSAGSATPSRPWANSFASTSSRWTGRNCRSTAPSAPGPTGPPRAWTAPSPSVPPATSARRARRSSSTRRFPGSTRRTGPTAPVTIGPYCRTPYTTDRFFHISAMSFGAISKPAVIALSRGAKAAGCWLNTGEGGLAPWHLEGGADVVFQMGTAKYGVRDADGRTRRGQAPRTRPAPAGEDDRGEAEPGRQAGQGRHPAGGQGHAGDRRDPRHSRRPGLTEPQPAHGHPRLQRTARFPRPGPRTSPASRWASRR